METDMPARYVLIPPPTEDYPWWLVADSEDGNKTMAAFSRDCPNAAKEARDLHSRLEKAAKVEREKED